MVEQTDRSGLSFFRNDKGIEKFQAMDRTGILEFVAQNPDQTGQVLHEMWRTGRSEEIHAIGQVNLQDNLPQQKEMWRGIIHGLALLRIADNMPTEKGTEFLKEAIPVVQRGIWGLAQEAPLEPEQETLVDQLTGAAINSINKVVDWLKK